jgi:hypothetical protein
MAQTDRTWRKKEGPLNILPFERSFPDKEPDSLSDMMQKKGPLRILLLERPFHSQKP